MTTEIFQDYHGFGPKDRQPPVDLGKSWFFDICNGLCV